MLDHDLLNDAQKRIQKHRAADIEFELVSGDGSPLRGAEVGVSLQRHEFKLGCNAFMLFRIGDAGLQKGYNERFADLLNFATLPFYWGGYEPEKNAERVEDMEKMVGWCAEHHITAKGHPLAWHEVFPKWAEELEDAEVLKRLEARALEIVEHFAGRIDIWDVVNEATVSARVENAVGRWMKDRGAASCVAEALDWAHDANPRATLLYNDFNVGDSFEALMSDLLQKRAPVHTCGIQSHMHKAEWPLQKAWDVCESYSRFGMPLHFTELTILSGRYKAEDDNDWHARPTDWLTTEEGEKKQLEYGSALYTLLFSHPAVEAITCWDFSDNGAWQAAPAGLIRNDMSRKPLYDWLRESFFKKWATDVSAATDDAGKMTARCYFGEHDLKVRASSGEEKTVRVDVRRRGVRKMRVVV